MTTENNPYATPTQIGAAQDSVPIDLEPKDRIKVEAVIKDAGQFWLAIILCILCSAIGAFIIPVWYLVRLLQWNSLANKYPALMSDDVPAKSIQARFKSSQWKLITGMVVGGVVFSFVALYILLLIIGVDVSTNF